MKAIVEIVVAIGWAMAIIMATFLLNFWIVHNILLLVGAKPTWYIIAISALMSAIWIFSHSAKPEEEKK